MSQTQEITQSDSLSEFSITSNDEVLVRVENLGKVFCRDFKKSLVYGLKDSVGDLFSAASNKNQREGMFERHLRPGEFWANKDISFELRRGECIGLIGHNGAGKTTLLKMLNGLIKPDAGRITIRGKVGALIALGAGFNPLLTGRENIYVNGSVLGFTREELDSMVEEIIDFAEIREFIDSAVQTYSSGMQVRLGFSIAVLTQPDILILDEVLAVGDAAFRAKSLERVSQLLKECAVIFVSHQANQVARICEQVLWLDSGRVIKAGDTQQLLSDYTESRIPEHTVGNYRKSGLGLEVTCEKKISVDYGKSFAFNIRVNTGKKISIGSIIMGFESQGGEVVAQGRITSNTAELNGTYMISLDYPELRLSPGCYWINLNIFEDPASKRHLIRMARCTELRVNGDNKYESPYTPHVKMNIQNIT